MEGFHIFRMVDKKIQVKAIANKAISTKHCLSKMVNKESKSLNMPVERQPIIDNTVNLMGVIDEFELNISAREENYKKIFNNWGLKNA